MDRHSLSPLMLAARDGHLAAVKFLLERKAVVDRANDDGVTALLSAAARGRTEIAACLLDHRADINKPGKHSGFTPLMKAARLNRVSCVKLLLERKADMTAKSPRGTTAIDVAQRHSEALSVLQFAQTAEPPPAAPAPAPRVSSTSIVSVVSGAAATASTADKADRKAFASQARRFTDSSAFQSSSTIAVSNCFITRLFDVGSGNRTAAD